jgi:microcystin-dependent protein
MSQPFVGEIRLVGFNFAPANWAFCNGQLLSITEFDVLFNLIGTTYGGDGQQTFALPDLRGRAPVHQGSGYIIGQLGGVENVTLATNTMPFHTHALMAERTAGNQPSPAGGVWAVSALEQFSTGAPTAAMGTEFAVVGQNQPHQNLPAYLVANYVISLFGIYPSQS